MTSSSCSHIVRCSECVHVRTRVSTTYGTVTDTLWDKYYSWCMLLMLLVVLYSSMEYMCVCVVVRDRGCRSRGPGFDSRHYQFFWEVVGLERGPLRLVSTIEELLGRNSSGSGLENREYGHGDPLRWPRDTLYPRKLALTSPTSGGRSVGIVRLRAKTTEFVLCVCVCVCVQLQLE
jgi:hypothetical protein